MADNQDAAGSGQGDASGAGTATVKVTVAGEEKVMTQADIQQMVEKHSSVEKKAQDVENMLKVVDRYGTDPSTYLENSEAAFRVMDTLINKGVIDNQGQLIQKVVDVKDKEDKVDLRPDADKLSEERLVGIVMKALKPKFEEFGTRLSEVDQGLSSVYRKDLQKEVITKHPELNEEDVSRLFGMATADKSKDLWGHAEVLVGIKREIKAEHEADFAKTHGIDLEAYRNKLKEQGADGGGASQFAGKRFQFDRGRKGLRDKDAVSPMQAMIEHGKATRQ